MGERLSYRVSVAMNFFEPTFQAESRVAEKEGVLKEGDYLTYFQLLWSLMR